MVDCDFFTEFNKSLIVESHRLLLDYKNCDYTIEIAFPNQQCRKINKTTSTNFIKKTPIKTVYGIIQMEVNKYLVAVTKASVIGQIYHRKIYQLQKVQFICLNNSQSSKDQPYLKGLQTLLENKYLYFSDDYDLTNSLQSFVGSGCSMKNKRLEYMYNGKWIDQFIKIKAYQWITGFISGFIAISFTHAGMNNACELALITRRDKRRQGMRWLTRGTDLDGNTANTAETEIIFLTEANGKEEIFSYVQLRGSMPFLWKQPPSLKWAPSCTINPNDRLNTDMTKKNYDDIHKNYENVALINLIDKKGTQKRLGQYFEKMHNSVGESTFKLVWFDFHAECKNMKYQNLSKLVEILEKQIENYGYFHMQTQNSGTTERRVSKKNAQKGIFRTNCMDCLDRTNVVQSVLGRQILLSWLVKLEIHHKGRHASAFEKLSSDSLEQIFRTQWTNNADVVSILYSGTPALKTDFTATGKRTFKGMMKDGDTSVRRFFLGNFFDNRKQDMIDFSLGQIQPSRSPKQCIRHSPLNSLYLIVLLVVMVPFLVSWQVDRYTTEQSPSLLMKVGISLLGVLILLKGCQSMKSVVLRSPIRSGNY